MIKYFIFLLMFFSFAFANRLSAQGTIPQEKPLYKRAKIFFLEENNLQKLTDLGIYGDHGVHKKDLFVISEFSADELARASQEGYEIEILIPDVKAHFLTQNESGRTRAAFNTTCDQNNETYPTPDNFNQGSMGGYLTYQEALNELAQMRALYPNLISEAANISNFLTEGNPDNSVTPSIGGNPIKWLRISDNPDTDENEPEILYTSIHHAREPMSLMQNIYFMWYLLENYDTDPEIQAIVDNTELYFVPVLNPDGYLYNEVTDPNGGGFWRKNRRGNGVDNNRNYDYHINGNPANGSWSGPGSSSNPNSQTYHGTGPFSEVENQAMKWFVEQHEFVIALNSHTFGELLYFPFSYADIPTPDETLFAAMGEELTSRNNYTALRDSPFSGDSDDFMYGTVGTHESIFSFTPEVGTSFWPAASSIDATCKAMMYQNITAAQMTNNYGQLTAAILQFPGDGLTATFPMDLRRLGVNGDGNFTISIEAVSSNIISTGDDINASLAILETESFMGSVTLDPAILEGESYSFTIIVDNGLYETSQQYSSIYGEPDVLFEDNGNSATANYENNNWGTTTATFQSPSSSITDSPNGDYSNNENSSIQISESIDLSEAAAATLSFYTRYEIETNWDYVQLEISTNGGASWEAQCTSLTSIGNSNQAEGEPLYQGTLNTWTYEEVNLSQYLGETITARFQLVTDNEVRRDGFYFDDLQIQVIEEEELSVDDSAFAKAFTFYPNPVKSTVIVASTLDTYDLKIYNILGQQVMQLNNLSGQSAINMSAMAPGMYFVEARTNTESHTFKIIKQ